MPTPLKKKDPLDEAIERLEKKYAAPNTMTWGWTGGGDKIYLAIQVSGKIIFSVAGNKEEIQEAVIDFSNKSNE